MSNYATLYSSQRKARKDKREVVRRLKGPYEPEALLAYDNERRRLVNVEMERDKKGQDPLDSGPSSSEEEEFNEEATFTDNWSRLKDFKGRCKRKVVDAEDFDPDIYDNGDDVKTRRIKKTNRSLKQTRKRLNRPLGAKNSSDEESSDEEGRSDPVYKPKPVIDKEDSDSGSEGHYDTTPKKKRYEDDEDEDDEEDEEEEYENPKYQCSPPSEDEDEEEEYESLAPTFKSSKPKPTNATEAFASSSEDEDDDVVPPMKNKKVDVVNGYQSDISKEDEDEISNFLDRTTALHKEDEDEDEDEEDESRVE
jgi:hypothetical protein